VRRRGTRAGARFRGRRCAPRARTWSAAASASERPPAR
jgi:hypothetical protein